MHRRPDVRTGLRAAGSCSRRYADDLDDGSGSCRQGIARTETPGGMGGLGNGCSTHCRTTIWAGWASAAENPNISMAVQGFQGLNETAGRIARVFDTHGELDQGVPDAQPPMAFRTELAVGRGSRMRHKRMRVAHTPGLA